MTDAVVCIPTLNSISTLLFRHPHKCKDVRLAFLSHSLSSIHWIPCYARFVCLPACALATYPDSQFRARRLPWIWGSCLEVYFRFFMPSHPEAMIGFNSHWRHGALGKHFYFWLSMTNCLLLGRPRVCFVFDFIKPYWQAQPLDVFWV